MSRRRRNDFSAIAGITGVIGIALGAKAIDLSVTYIQTHHTAAITVGVLTTLAATAAVLGRYRQRLAAASNARRGRTAIHLTDTMTGTQFEHWCANLLRRSGLHHVHVVG
jgi:hypothetical protein